MANSFLSRTPGSTTDAQRKQFTISVWVKRSTLLTGSDHQEVLSAFATDQFGFRFQGDNKLDIFDYSVSGNNYPLRLITNRLFRDTSAWYNIVLQVDTPNATSSNRAKLWVNGVQETSFATATYPSQDYTTTWNKNGLHQIGSKAWGNSGNGSNFFDGYLSHVANVAGSVVAPTVFGETDSTSGIWKFKSPSGITWGTNGFHLKFENSAALGTDSSGNSNTFTVNGNLQQTIDTPSNVYAVLNSLDGHLGNSTFSYGNTRFNSGTNSNVTYTTSTLGMTSGKFYFEAKLEQAADHNYIGIADVPSPSTSHYFGNTAYEYGYKSSSGDKKNNNTSTSYGNTYTTGDILGCAVDLDNNKIYFSKNGVFQDSGDPTSGATGTGAAFTIAAPSATTTGRYFFCVADGTTSNASIWNANFGSGYFANNAVTSNSGAGEQDDAGQGKFQYDVPSGYYALNTKNVNTYG